MKLDELSERFTRINLQDRTQWANQTLNFVRELGNMLVLAKVITLGALARNETRGAHYKPEFPNRDDANWLKTTIASYNGGDIQLAYEAGGHIAAPAARTQIHRVSEINGGANQCGRLQPGCVKVAKRSAKSIAAPAARTAVASVRAMADKTFIVRIKRQQRPDEAVRWEEYELRYRPHMNVIICLRDIAEHPFTRDGNESSPVSYEANCLEEICGACAMLVNGKPRQACTALVDELEKPIRLEPLTKFPLIRDLQVDRSSMFENLKRTKCWIPIDGTYDIGPGPRMSPRNAGSRLSRFRSASPAATAWKFARR